LFTRHRRGLWQNGVNNLKTFQTAEQTQLLPCFGKGSCYFVPAVNQIFNNKIPYFYHHCQKWFNNFL
ncbi:MAG: hypothetical protein MJE68_32445, partial [Proteobacteria bacterium]|nr:hypothetical protein [Pseudomonadota bacterium]